MYGGFHEHFESKDQLVAEALAEAAVMACREILAPAVSKGAGAAAAYILPDHRDNPGTGCLQPAANSPEAMRKPERPRRLAS
jgi:TetR/AcrR family transcriptional repressor of nem operon